MLMCQRDIRILTSEDSHSVSFVTNTEHRPPLPHATSSLCYVQTVFFPLYFSSRRNTRLTPCIVDAHHFSIHGIIDEKLFWMPTQVANQGAGILQISTSAATSHLCFLSQGPWEHRCIFGVTGLFLVFLLDWLLPGCI